MAAFLLYIIKSTCCLVLFYLGYKALLSHETFYRFNRGVLLGGMLFCMLLPLVEIRTLHPNPLQKPLLQLEEVITEEIGAVASAENLPVRELLGEGVVSDQPGYGWGNVLMSVYAGGIGFGLCLLGISFASLLQLLKSGRRIRQEGYLLILTGRDMTPFNWGNYILLSEKDYHDHPGEILTHELVHCRKHHSLDLIFAEAVILLHWFNPAAWLLKKELQEVHEYQADCGVLQSGIDATKYQLLLVKKAVSASSYTFANSFNHSTIKKRITMMLKEKSNRWARLKLALLVPVAACTMVAFARPDVSRKLEQFVESEGTTISPDEQSYTREFFDKELNRYLEKAGKADLAYEQKLSYLKDHTHMINFYVNGDNQILYDNKHRKMDEVPAALEAALKKKYADGKPVLFFFLRDLKTSEVTIRKMMEMTGRAFAGYRATDAGKDAPMLFFYGEPKNMDRVSASEAKSKNSIELTFLSPDKKTTWVAYIGPDLDSEAIRKQFAGLDAKDVLSVSFKAPKDTPMGRITDIKQALREVYALKVKYEMDCE